MRKITSIVLLLTFPAIVLADAGTTWTKVRYNGGPLKSTVGPKDWDNTFTVAPDDIRFVTKDGQTFDVKPGEVTALSYGAEAHRHVAMFVTLGIVVAPIALFGLLHKQRLHFIGIEYAKADSSKGGLLIQGADQNYREMLFQLKSVTGKPIIASDKDKEEINP